MAPGQITISVDETGRVYEGQTFRGQVFGQEIQASLRGMSPTEWFEAVNESDISLGWYGTRRQAMLALVVGNAIPGSQATPG